MACGICKLIDCLDRIYVGSSLDIRGRVLQHMQKLRAGKHDNWRLQSAYALGQMRHDIIELCPPEMLASREQFWIDRLSPKFNLAKVAIRSDFHGAVKPTSLNVIDPLPHGDGKRIIEIDYAGRDKAVIVKWLQARREFAYLRGGIFAVVSPTLQKNLIECPHPISLRKYNGVLFIAQAPRRVRVPGAWKGVVVREVDRKRKLG